MLTCPIELASCGLYQVQAEAAARAAEQDKVQLKEYAAVAEAARHRTQLCQQVQCFGHLLL